MADAARQRLRAVLSAPKLSPKTNKAKGYKELQVGAPHSILTDEAEAMHADWFTSLLGQTIFILPAHVYCQEANVLELQEIYWQVCCHNTIRPISFPLNGREICGRRLAAGRIIHVKVSLVFVEPQVGWRTISTRGRDVEGLQLHRVPEGQKKQQLGARVR